MNLSTQQKLSSEGWTWKIARLKSEVWWVWMGVMAERQAEARLWRDSAGRGYAIDSGEPSRHFWKGSINAPPRVWGGHEME